MFAEGSMPEAKLFVEKRSNPRIPVKLPVKFSLVDDAAGIQNIREMQKKENLTQTGDMSLGGIYIIADQRLEVGTILHLDFTLPDKPNQLTSFAEVVWSNASGAGLRFIMIKGEDMEKLQSFLTEPPPSK
jgi:Tfp pilus assembly protein PilZ